MITIFNRRELCVTFDTAEQARLRNLLADNKIDYSVKTINRMSPSAMSTGERGRVGTYGQDAGAMYEYKIYVHREDYARAKYLIEK